MARPFAWLPQRPEGNGHRRRGPQVWFRGRPAGATQATSGLLNGTSYAARGYRLVRLPKSRNLFTGFPATLPQFPEGREEAVLTSEPTEEI